MPAEWVETVWAKVNRTTERERWACCMKEYCLSRQAGNWDGARRRACGKDADLLQW